MADGFDRLTAGIGRAADEISLNLIRRELLEYEEGFSSLKADYYDAGSGLTLESATFERIKAEKYTLPFEESINAASRNDAKVQDVLRESGGDIWALQ